MNRLITGTNKNGKTNFGVAEIDKWLAEFPDRVCYSNIKGLSQTTERVEELPSDANWLSVPEGSLVVYDEADVFPFLKGGEKGLSSDPRVAELARSAHGNRSVWFITQDPMLLHHHARKFINEHVHLVRILGMEASTRWSWNERAADKPDDFHEQQKADKSVFFFRKDLYGRYVGSSGGHDIKMRLPKKVLLIGGLALSLLGFTLYKVFSGSVFFLGGENSERSQLEEKKSSGGLLGGVLPGSSPRPGGLVDDSGMPLLSYVERFQPAVPFKPWTAPAYAELQPTQVPELYCLIGGDTQGCHCYTEQVTLVADVPDSMCRKFAVRPQYNPFRKVPVVGQSFAVASAPEPSPAPVITSGKGYLPVPAFSGVAAASDGVP